MEWLDELEAKVKEAGKTVAELRRRNRSLKAKVRRLENQVASPAKDAESNARWSRERKQIRERVDHLARQLEKLLAE